MRSGEEIQSALRKFVTRWRDYAGSERGEAQTYLNELIACYGTDRKEAGAEFEDAHTADGIMDMYWPDVCIVEMKAPSQAGKLPEHRKQALDYWHSSDDPGQGRPAPPYVVLCAFQRFEVWEPGRFPSGPRAGFALAELAENYEKLLFLAGTDQEPLFGTSYKELTTEAAKVVAELYQALLERKAAAPETLRSFLLQIVWCLFAEDLGMLGGHPVQRIIEDLIRHPERSSYVELGALFEVLNDPDDYGRHGVLEGTQYVNGSLFAQPAKVHLQAAELRRLAQAAQFDWRKVDPTIFGSLMEGCLGYDRRWELGAHYTHEADIMKIVRPTIVEPWRQRAEAATTAAAVRQVLDELCAFRVLDPACGCGNFLYIAYRELRSLEHELKERIVAVARKTGMPVPERNDLPYYPLGNLRGIDIEPTAVMIARVTLWMGQRQMIDRFGAAEPVLPLVDLSGIAAGDALAQPWPKTDCIVGNPPFHGSQQIRATLGDAYAEWLKTTFQVGLKDYCVYWFRKAHEHLTAGQRAGLVGTNSISQNRARGVSLEYITANGGVITDAVSTQDWPGEAGVDVSLVNWIKMPGSPPAEFVLDGKPVPGITPELRTPDRSTGIAVNLAANRGRSFQGPIPAGAGFILAEDEARALLAQTDADYSQVVRPYLIGDDIAEDPAQKPRRWIIDFAKLPLEAAMGYPAALAIVRERVKPVRETNNRAAYRQYWWQFAEARREMRTALKGLGRYIAGVAQGKRLLFAWADAWTCPSNLTNVFAFDDDYAMGILSSSAHGAWAKRRSSTLEDRLRYTPSTVFASFPWPYPVSAEQREEISALSASIIRRRQEICAASAIGLTTLYNQVDEGAYADLKALHRKLDEAVAGIYGWPKVTAHDGDAIVQRLLELNREISAGKRRYDPFGAQAASAMNELPMQDLSAECPADGDRAGCYRR
ncbi:MAG TPA: DNA methyltransferase [Streptosporangiaceae bacterium]|nr:DNA methyltransferase [Streptosporangiaceae bacterium]